jgi:hypothetical protein
VFLFLALRSGKALSPDRGSLSLFLVSLERWIFRHGNPAELCSAVFTSRRYVLASLARKEPRDVRVARRATRLFRLARLCRAEGRCPNDNRRGFDKDC